MCSGWVSWLIYRGDAEHSSSEGKVDAVYWLRVREDAGGGEWDRGITLVGLTVTGPQLGEWPEGAPKMSEESRVLSTGSLRIRGPFIIGGVPREGGNDGGMALEDRGDAISGKPAGIASERWDQNPWKTRHRGSHVDLASVSAARKE